MAHFLIRYNTVKRIEQDCPNNSMKFSMSVLEEWEVTTPNTLRTWQHLKSILTFLGLNNLIDQVEGVSVVQFFSNFLVFFNFDFVSFFFILKILSATSRTAITYFNSNQA